MDWLHFLANPGTLGLMFMVGFEIDVERLRESWHAGIIMIGVSALMLPLAGVFVTGQFQFNLPILASSLLTIGLRQWPLPSPITLCESAALCTRKRGKTSSPPHRSSALSAWSGWCS